MVALYFTLCALSMYLQCILTHENTTVSNVRLRLGLGSGLVCS